MFAATHSKRLNDRDSFQTLTYANDNLQRGQKRCLGHPDKSFLFALRIIGFPKLAQRSSKWGVFVCLTENEAP